MSPSGTLAYVLDTSPTAADSTIVWVNQKGEEQPTPAKASRYNGEPRISPDGTKAAILVTTGIPIPDNRIPGGGDIWVVDLERGTSHSVTRQENVRSFVWSRDGKRIIYSRLVFASRGRSSASGGSPSSAAGETSVSQLFSAAADGVGTPILLKERQSTTPYVPSSVARDGTLIGGNRGNANTPNTPARRGQIGELWLLSTTQADADVRPFRNFPSWVFNARFSPDDRLVAYQSADSNQFEIYVVPYPGRDGERVQVSPGGGTNPTLVGKPRAVLPQRRQSDEGGFSAQRQVRSSKNTVRETWRLRCSSRRPVIDDQTCRAVQYANARDAHHPALVRRSPLRRSVNDRVIQLLAEVPGGISRNVNIADTVVTTVRVSRDDRWQAV